VLRESENAFERKDVGAWHSTDVFSGNQAAGAAADQVGTSRL